MNIDFIPKKDFDSFCEASKNTVCPFTNKKCFKLSRAKIGICALEHNNMKQIICPSLFPRKDIFDSIANDVIRTKNYTVFSEVKLGDNYLDFLMVDNNDKNNFCGIEFQALDTSGNYRWLFGEKVKPFCINWKTTKKTIMSQLIIKTNMFLKEKRKLVLVVQKTFLDYIHFQNLKNSLDGEVIILAFDYNNNVASNFRFFSVDFADLITSFSDDQVCLNDIINKTIKDNRKIVNI